MHSLCAALRSSSTMLTTSLAAHSSHPGQMPLFTPAMLQIEWHSSDCARHCSLCPDGVALIFSTAPSMSAAAGLLLLLQLPWVHRRHHPPLHRLCLLQATHPRLLGEPVLQVHSRTCPGERRWLPSCLAASHCGDLGNKLRDPCVSPLSLHQFASPPCLQAATSTPTCASASVSPPFCIQTHMQAQTATHCSQALSSFAVSAGLPCSRLHPSSW